MRILLLVLAALIAGVYFTLGLRFGYVTLTPTYMFNATGESRYTYQIYDEGQKVGVRGKCEVRGGSVTLRLLDPQGGQIAGQACPKGKYGLNLMASGQPGFYQLLVTYDKFSGVLDLDETRR